jgi:predicted DNA-binding transcriptional regulator YafY
MRLFRLFTLMDQLRIRTLPVPARELAAAMNVSIRSIYRDIADLQAMGAPIRGEGGVGYVMERGYFMPSLAFTPGELDAIALGLKFVGERSSESLAAAADSALGKIASAVGADARQDLLEATLAAGPSAAGQQAKAGRLYDSLREAVARRDRLRITYVDGGGKKSERLARPLGLTSFDTSWLLTIWCERANAFRHLRLDRIMKAEPTGETFRHERGRRFSDALKIEHEKLGRPIR